MCVYSPAQKLSTTSVLNALINTDRHHLHNVHANLFHHPLTVLLTTGPKMLSVAVWRKSNTRAKHVWWWVGVVWPVNIWCRYQPVSKRLCPCTQDTLSINSDNFKNKLLYKLITLLNKPHLVYCILIKLLECFLQTTTQRYATIWGASAFNTVVCWR